MAETTAQTALRVTQWENEFFEEYVRENQFAPFMGTAMNSIIQVKDDLTKKKGESITLPFVTRLNGGVAGNTILEGQEEVLDNYGFNITVDTIRNAVITNELEEQASAIDIRDAAREMLKYWAIDKMRGGSLGGTGSETSTDSVLGKFGVIDNLMAFYDGTTYAMYRDASEAVKDLWLANNSDRVLFGAAVSNNAANDHSAALLNIDDTADKLTAANLVLAKRLAKKANPHIRPFKTKKGQEWFVYFANSIAFRNLKTDATITQANREAWVRYSTGDAVDDNPIFTDNDIIYDGVIVKEVPEIPFISGVGAGGINVAPGFLCGAQALGSVWAKRTKSTVNQEGGSDYEYRFGVGVRDIRGMRKLFANNKQWSCFTHYTSNVE